MNNQLDNQARRLAEILAQNRLIKIGGDQTITHRSVDSQRSIGREHTQAIAEDDLGVNAATAAATNNPQDTIPDIPNCQDLNADPAAVMARTGTKIDNITQTGDKMNIPKTASDYRIALAQILNRLNNRSGFVKSASQVMQKMASLSNRRMLTPAEQASLEDDLVKLASTNPIFSTYRDNIYMNKLAEDVAALAEAENIPPEVASDVLDTAAAKDPSILEDAHDEATGEAVANLADAEEEADAMMDGVQQLADNASEFYGEEVTPDDILDAVDEVVEEAEVQGVDPEDLIAAAIDDIQGEEEITPEEEAAAQEILDEAAANGIAPEEVIEMAAQELEEALDEEIPEEAILEDEGVEKQASYWAATPRARYIQSLLHR